MTLAAPLGFGAMIRSTILAATVAVLALALGSGQAVASVKLRATIAQATPTPSAGGELSGDPGLPDGDETADAGTGGASSGDASGGSSTDDQASSGDAGLPNTGANSLLLGLVGVSLVAAGLGLRGRLAHAGPTA